MNSFLDIDDATDLMSVPTELSHYSGETRRTVAPQRPGIFQTSHSGLVMQWVDGRPVGGTVRSVGLIDRVGKRLLDVTVAFVAILCLMPLFAIVAAAVKLTSSGPVFFRQVREGVDGSRFHVLKFRSMRVDAGDPTGVTQTVAGDRRLTSIGNFLRRTSIDELPQLFNVIRGDMSLVGPRPHVPGMLAAGVAYTDLVSYYDARHAVKPGLTGWAQANGLRGPTTNPVLAISRVDHDLAYIHNWNLLLDCKILLLTVWRELRGGTGS